MKALLKNLNPAQTRSIEVLEFMTLSSPLQERHARIEIREGQVFIKDLRSPAGTFVNETQIAEAILHDGDIIRLGEVEYVFCETPQPGHSFPIKSRNMAWNQELQNLKNVARTDLPVLILGPSGTGKDVIAHALHQQGPRSTGPFVSVNCSALTEALVESELFGHIKGSFTGAVHDRKGAFETARGGTLFLDEIGDLSYTLQAKLLRALENDEIRPVGSDRSHKTDVRIIAATHQNLHDKIREGNFRSDLYFRLNVVSVSPPALHMRMEDFEDLLYTFAKQSRVRFSLAAIQHLRKHKWPGNIRELKNLVSRASALYPKQTIEEVHAEYLIDKTFAEPGEERLESIPVMKEIEKHMIVQKLSLYRGNQRRTAQDLGMAKSTLHDRLKYYKIDAREFKMPPSN